MPRSGKTGALPCPSSCDDPAMRVENVTRRTVVADRVRVARSTRDRTVGLLNRDGLADGEGLWIERSPSIHMFFMRFPIDAVFIGADGRVTKVVPDLKPWRVVWWARGARDCLELATGAAARSGTQPGRRAPPHRYGLDLPRDREAVDVASRRRCAGRTRKPPAWRSVVTMSSTTMTDRRHRSDRCSQREGIAQVCEPRGTIEPMLLRRRADPLEEVDARAREPRSPAHARRARPGCSHARAAARGARGPGPAAPHRSARAGAAGSARRPPIAARPAATRPRTSAGPSHAGSVRRRRRPRRRAPGPGRSRCPDRRPQTEKRGPMPAERLEGTSRTAARRPTRRRRTQAAAADRAIAWRRDSGRSGAIIGRLATR